VDDLCLTPTGRLQAHARPITIGDDANSLEHAVDIRAETAANG
jgi:hypothetical protein